MNCMARKRSATERFVAWPTGLCGFRVRQPGPRDKIPHFIKKWCFEINFNQLKKASACRSDWIYGNHQFYPAWLFRSDQ
nr:hypothetical protein SHINE37_10326 [Rhizobiaceae bacterium]